MYIVYVNVYTSLKLCFNILNWTHFLLEIFSCPITEKISKLFPEKFPNPILEKYYGIGYKKFLRMGYEKFLRIGYEIFLGNYHWKITRPGQTSATVCVHPRNFSLENLSPEILGKISYFCRHFYRVFPWKIPRNFHGFTTKLLPECMGWTDIMKIVILL